MIPAAFCRIVASRVPMSIAFRPRCRATSQITADNDPAEQQVPLGSKQLNAQAVPELPLGHGLVRAGDLRPERLADLATTSCLHELRINQAGGELVRVSADDRQPFAFQQRPPQSVVHHPVDRVTVDLPFGPVGIAEPVTFNPDTVGRRRRVRESLRDIPQLD